MKTWRMKDVERVHPHEWGWRDPDGVSWESPVEAIVTGVLGWCGCVEPDGLLCMVRDVMRDTEAGELKNGKACVIYGHCAVDFVTVWLDAEGLTEHGTSIRYPWLTEHGKTLLADLEEITKDMEP